MASTPEGISTKAFKCSCRDGVNYATKGRTRTNPQRGHARQLRDVVGHGDQAFSFKLYHKGDA